MNKCTNLLLVTILAGVSWAGTSEEEGKKFVNEISQKTMALAQDLVAKEWAADTANKANKEKAKKGYAESSKKWDAYQKEFNPELMKFPWKTFKDPNTKYMFKLLSFTQENVLTGDKSKKYTQLVQDINEVSDKALMKEYKSADNKPKLKPTDVNSKAVKDFKNIDEMNFYWKEYHDTLGKPMKNLFAQLMELENENAHLKKYKDATELWDVMYEIDNFENTMFELYKQIEPLYKELHAYIRYNLWVATGKKDDIVDPKGPIPANILGYNWGEDAASLFDLLEPYPKKPRSDASPQLKAKGYTAKKMAETAENFFVSLGLSKMPAEFWTHSIFEKKGDMACSPSTYDFSNGKDYRLIFCAEPTQSDFASMHEYLGDIEYDMAGKNLPYLFQKETNIPFSQAFDSMITSFSLAPAYLNSLGLLDPKVPVEKEQIINNLLFEALDQVFYLPYAYACDQWRWSVLRGQVTPQNYNCEYWKRRISLQGVEPPVDRDENDFDIGTSSWFITGGQHSVDYVSRFMTYNMISGLCKTAGTYDPKTKPLIFCGINGSKAAGDKLKEMMAVGGSHPWHVAYEKVTGKNKLDASGLLEYFQPLYEWLQEENKKNKVTVGWNAGHNRCH